MSSKQKEILFLIIKIYASPQDDYLKSTFGIEDFNIAKRYFEDNVEFFLNKKMGIDKIYNSLFNIGSSYISFRYIISEHSKTFQNKEDEKKAFISFNEPFVNSVILNLNLFHELIKNSMFKISTAPEFKPHFSYINGLCNRIKKSSIISIRDTWVAHPFKNKHKGIIYSPKEIHESVLEAFKTLCNEHDKKEFENSKGDRLAWFCLKYIVDCIETPPSIKEAVHSVLNNLEPPVHRISTRPKEMLIEMNKFSTIIRDEKLFGIEPFFNPSEQDIELIKVNGLQDKIIA